jgi:hypothetical protein
VSEWKATADEGRDPRRDGQRRDERGEELVQEPTVTDIVGVALVVGAAS